MSFRISYWPQRFRGCFPCGCVNLRCFNCLIMVVLLVYESHAFSSIVADYGITFTTNNSVYRTLLKITTMDNDKICRVTRNKRITVGPIV